MIGSQIFLYEGLLIAFGIIVPVGLTIWWVVTRKEKITTVLAGAATWFVFAVLLEAIPKYFFFNPDTALGQTVIGNVVLFSAIGALLAGIFEEPAALYQSGVLNLYVTEVMLVVYSVVFFAIVYKKLYKGHEGK